jgi:hypothetical protein
MHNSTSSGSALSSIHYLFSYYTELSTSILFREQRHCWGGLQQLASENYNPLQKEENEMETAKANPTLTRKLNKILETRIDGQELVTALETLSQFYGKNTLQARRNLRGIVEKRGLEINRNFLEVFLRVQQVN